MRDRERAHWMHLAKKKKGGWGEGVRIKNK